MAISLRKAYGEILAKLGEENDSFVVIVADTGSGTGVDSFIKRFPQRSFDVGIAEQNLMGVAAGFSTVGITVFANTYGVFASSRTADQIRNSICYPQLNVKIVASHVGLDAGSDGASHQTFEDLAIMRSIPNMIVLVPADAVELEAMLKFLLTHKGPAYVRTTRAAMEDVNQKPYAYRLGKSPVLEKGSDVTIIATGVMIKKALEAREALEKQKVSAEIINCSTLKPLDSETILESAKKTGAVVTAEDHSILNGMGSAISELLSQEHHTPMEFIGMRDVFGAAGDVDQLYIKFGMSAQHIAQAAMKVIKKKKERLV